MSPNTLTNCQLSASKEFVSLLGGKLNVESEMDKGSTFWITLPLK